MGVLSRTCLEHLQSLPDCPLCNMSGLRVLIASLFDIVCSTTQAFSLASDKRSNQANRHACMCYLLNYSTGHNVSQCNIMCSTAQASCLASDKHVTRRDKEGFEERSRAQIHRFTHFQNASMSGLRVLPAFLCNNSGCGKHVMRRWTKKASWRRHDVFSCFFASSILCDALSIHNLKSIT
jgi:hypothetical protein